MTININDKTHECTNEPHYEKDKGYIPSQPCKHNFTDVCFGCQVFSGNDDLPLLFTA